MRSELCRIDCFYASHRADNKFARYGCALHRVQKFNFQYRRHLQTETYVVDQTPFLHREPDIRNQQPDIRNQQPDARSQQPENEFGSDQVGPFKTSGRIRESIHRDQLDVCIPHRLAMVLNTDPSYSAIYVDSQERRTFFDSFRLEIND